jgi:hypothetical protein
MAVPEDFRLIRELVEHGGHKHVVGNVEQRQYRGLVELGWVTIQSTSDLVHAHYQVTDRGRAAALRSGWDGGRSLSAR